MSGRLQLHTMAHQHRATHTNPDPDPEDLRLQAQIQNEPGRFRLLLNHFASEALLVLDEPLEEDSAQSGAVPARSIGSPSRFFERHEEELASHKGRLPAAKEREANEKAKLVSIS